ncbi:MULTISPECIES: quercetin 2,3-dioxygenase [unclassified Mesorhizobium]|uniref:quercetin 2,3-dioxygenase n=1 Tax=unclassified Mesorhizobium TaxID=325217 RepID=UPI003336965B
MDTNVVEITEFALKPGFTEQMFLQTRDEVNDEVRKLKGFINRRLLKSEGGWTEILEWADIDSAKSAGEVWSTLPGIKNYCSMVNSASIKVGYHSVAAVASGGAGRSIPHAFCSHALDGEARWWLGSLAVIKATAAQTAGQFTLVEVLESEGEAPLHVHHREDESFLVMEGEIEFEIGGKAIMAGPGSFLFGPRDVPHRYTVKRGPARMLFLFTPGGFEELLEATSVPAGDRRIPPDGEGMPDMKTFPDVVRHYGCELLG